MDEMKNKAMLNAQPAGACLSLAIPFEGENSKYYKFFWGWFKKYDTYE